MIKILLEDDSDDVLEISNDEGQTPLLIAIANEQDTSALLLIEKGSLGPFFITHICPALTYVNARPRPIP